MIPQSLHPPGLGFCERSRECKRRGPHACSLGVPFEKVNGELVPRLALAFSQVASTSAPEESANRRSHCGAKLTLPKIPEVIDKLVLRFQESSFSWVYNTLGCLTQAVGTHVCLSSCGDVARSQDSTLCFASSGVVGLEKPRFSELILWSCAGMGQLRATPPPPPLSGKAMPSVGKLSGYLFQDAVRDYVVQSLGGTVNAA